MTFTTRCDIATSERILDQPNRCFWIINFYDQFVVPLVMQVNDDSVLRVMHVPEDPLAVLIKGARRDDSGHVSSGHPDPVIPATCSLGVCPDTRNVDERYFETALERPELSAPQTCSISLPSAIDKSTNGRLLSVRSHATFQSVNCGVDATAAIADHYALARSPQKSSTKCQ